MLCEYLTEGGGKFAPIQAESTYTLYYTSTYFDPERPYCERENRFNLTKHRKKIQLEKKNDKLSIFLAFVGISPVFD